MSHSWILEINSQFSENKDNLKSEDNLKSMDNLKNEDTLKKYLFWQNFSTKGWGVHPVQENNLFFPE